MTGETITKRQMADLLTYCSQFDGRALTPVTFESWHDLLGDLPYEDVKEAVYAHYRRPAPENPAERRWSGITPQDIMAHHQKLAAGRAVEAVRHNPPGCWGGNGCGVNYVLSDRPGSDFAFPDSLHADGCRVARWFTNGGVLRFSRVKNHWGITDIDPVTFDEEAYVGHERKLAESLERGGTPWALPEGPRTDWVARLAIGGAEEVVD